MAAFSFIQKLREIKSRTEVQGHRIFFSAGKTGMEECCCIGKCSAALSTEIASIGLCQPQSNPQPKGVWTSLRGRLRSATVRAGQMSTGRLVYCIIHISPNDLPKFPSAALSSVNDATTSLPFSALQTENLFCVI